MKEETFDWTMNVFEYVLGYSAVEWKELNSYIKENGGDENGERI